MKTFKGYLTEAPAWTESLSTMLFDLPRVGLKDVKIPLSPSIMKRIWPKSIRSKAFHVTNDDGVRKMKKLQGGKRSISAFYNIHPSMIGGIKTEGGYVIELEGDVLVAAPDDISSQPDKTGRRWLTFSSLMNPSTDSDPGLGGKAKLKGMEKDIEDMMWKIINTHTDYPKSMAEMSINAAWIELQSERKLYKKVMSFIIKDYMDGIEKIMKKYSKPLKSLFTDYAFDKELVPDPDSGDYALWDEVVVNNFKVKKVLVSAQFSPDFEGDDPLENSDFGWDVPFELYDDDGDLVDYIARARN